MWPGNRVRIMVKKKKKKERQLNLVNSANLPVLLEEVDQHRLAHRLEVFASIVHFFHPSAANHQVAIIRALHSPEYLDM